MIFYTQKLYLIKVVEKIKEITQNLYYIKENYMVEGIK